MQTKKPSPNNRHSIFDFTRSKIHLVPWISLLWIGASCGPPQQGPYYPDKTFGQGIRSQTPGEEIGGDAVTNPEEDTPNDGEPVLETDNSSSPDGQKPDKPGENPTDTNNDPPPDPNKIVRRWSFGVAYDKASVKGLRNGANAPLSLGGVVLDNVRSRLIPGPEDGLLISQNHGDGKGSFQTFFGLTNSVADANRPTQAPSISGLRTATASTLKTCPADNFLCAERILMAPLKGQVETLCFLDPATGAPAAYPLAVRPEAKPDDLAKYMGTMGPYHARIYQGDVSCSTMDDKENPGKGQAKGPYVTETITAKISKASLDGLKMQLHTANPITPDFGVTIENIRQTGNLMAPYLDETARLSGASTFYISSQKKLLVKTVIQSRLSLDVARSLGGGIFAGFIDQLINLDGIMVDVHYEFCRDILVPDSIDHCPKTPPAP